VLGFVVADLLFREFPESDEGLKSKSKAALVSTAALARLAERLRLGEYLLLGRGEEKTGGRKKPALLADAYEALIAAIYLDGGIEQARSFLAREMADLVADLKSRGAVAGQDDKSALQEWLQSQNRPLPEYRIVGALGPDHNRLFEVEIVASGETIGRGSGTTKKEAEQAAARSALERLRA
jgi:ribonuclease III